jgi:hypothetical protein
MKRPPAIASGAGEGVARCPPRAFRARRSNIEALASPIRRRNAADMTVPTTDPVRDSHVMVSEWERAIVATKSDNKITTEE